MPETASAATPKLDLDELMERIRAEVAEQKRVSGEVAASGIAETPVAAPDVAPRTFSARELLAMPVADFARAAHLALLGREPEPHEFVRLRDRLLVQHVGRMRVLREFRRSSEGRARRLHVEGLWREFAWDHLYWSPPAKFGRFVGRFFADVYRAPRRIREFVERIEMLERRAAEAKSAIRGLQLAHAADKQNLGTQTRRLQDELATVRQNLAERSETIERNFASRTRALEGTAAQTEVAISDIRRNLVDHWRGIVDQKLRMEAFLGAAGSAFRPEPNRAERGVFADEESHLLDALYLSFEDRYRGTRAEIKERQTVYLPRIEACVAATGGAPVIDVGCGRGEWLELLAESGISARGYDLNRIAVEECRQRGLEAILADALEALADLPDNSCSAITGFHIIEHVAFETLVTLLDHSLRVLRPGGLLLLETPNPANVIVAAERFYFDPTHRNPLPSELTTYLLKSRGFDEVEMLPLHPVVWPSRREYDDPMLTFLQDKLFGPQDYGLAGRKPA